MPIVIAVKAILAIFSALHRVLHAAHEPFPHVRAQEGRLLVRTPKGVVNVASSVAYNLHRIVP